MFDFAFAQSAEQTLGNQREMFFAKIKLRIVDECGLFLLLDVQWRLLLLTGATIGKMFEQADHPSFDSLKKIVVGGGRVRDRWMMRWHGIGTVGLIEITVQSIGRRTVLLLECRSHHRRWQCSLCWTWGVSCKLRMTNRNSACLSRRGRRWKCHYCQSRSERRTARSISIFLWLVIQLFVFPLYFASPPLHVSLLLPPPGLLSFGSIHKIIRIESQCAYSSISRD